jgi:hypothetical protein
MLKSSAFHYVKPYKQIEKLPKNFTTKNWTEFTRHRQMQCDGYDDGKKG